MRLADINLLRCYAKNLESDPKSIEERIYSFTLEKLVQALNAKINPYILTIVQFHLPSFINCRAVLDQC